MAELSTTDIIKIGQDLCSREIKSVKFLCRKIISLNKLEKSNDFPTLLKTFLECSNLPTSENRLIASQLLCLIHRNDLIKRFFDVDIKSVETSLEDSKYFNTFRIKVLYRLCLDMDENDVTNFKFLLNDGIPKVKCNSVKEAEDLFIMLEHKFPNENELMDFLHKTFTSLNLYNLVKIVTDFDNKSISKAYQETCHDTPADIYFSGSTDNNVVNSTPKCSPEITNENYLNQSFSKTFKPSRENSGSSLETSNSSFSENATPSEENSECSMETSNSSSENNGSEPESLNSLSPPRRYPMKQKNKGICLIINNETFDEKAKLSKRKGSDYDKKSIEKLFNKMKFEVRTYDNLKSDEMVSKLEEISKLDDHINYDCFICFILSHGNIGYVVYGTDGREVNLLSLTKPFHKNLCPMLKDKPKLFFIQACQGDDIVGANDELETDNAKTFKLVEDPDFLLSFASLQGFASIRSTNNGTWFISTLIPVLEKYYKSWEINALLQEVNNRLIEKTGRINNKPVAQISMLLNTLCKCFYFV